MVWIERKIKEMVKRAANSRPAVLLTGMRQSGKTSLLKKIFYEADYVSLDNKLLAEEAKNSPKKFFEKFKNSKRVIIDEIQYAPDLLRELKIIIDNDRSTKGRWILTGSQKFSLIDHISESLAGRIRIIELDTLSSVEIRDSRLDFSIEDLIYRGGFPELWADKDQEVDLFYEDYVTTYLERDVRSVLNVSDLRDFQKFMQLLSLRTASLLNYAELAKDTGISPNTVKSWVSVLEASGIITVLPPYSENFGKRLIKTPKVYYSDNGVLSHLLNIKESEDFRYHPLGGNIWENFVISELAKTVSEKPGRGLYFYRDSNGVELDALIIRGRKVMAIEAKMAENVDERKLNFKKVLPLFEEKGYETEAIVAAPIVEGIVHLKNYTLINPALESLVSYK